MNMKRAAQGADALEAEALAAQEAAQAAAEAEEDDEDAGPIWPVTRIPRTDRLKVGVKFTPADYQHLVMFAAGLTAETGTRITHQAILNELMRELIDNPRLKNRIAHRLADKAAYDRRVREGREHIGRPRKNPIRKTS